MSIYLESFTFPSNEEEFHLYYHQPSALNNLYPAGVLTEKLRKIEFSPVTIFYGGNGSGKSTALNLIAENLEITRTTPYNKSTFFENYAKKLCHSQMYNYTLCKKIITSDDVFKSLFTTRERNEQIDRNREDLYDKFIGLNLTMFSDFVQDKDLLEYYDDIKDMNYAKSHTKNRFAISRGEKNIIGKSNGETALDYFMAQMQEEGLYLLDEPENSLSAPFQAELAKFLYNCARFFNCQIVIATHSPFMLAIDGAKIFNLDNSPAGEIWDWTKLENMKIYYDLFTAYKDKFERK
ncbi:MAG: AAA family ATPase [Clostridia bacterium]